MKKIYQIPETRAIQMLGDNVMVLVGSVTIGSGGGAPPSGGPQ
jgi:hypothetical protein